MPTIKVNGIDMYYELHGRGDPLVLISGYTCDHTSWGMMIEELAKYFQVLLFDNRAVGKTKDDGRDFTIETMADDTMGLIQALELNRPHIAGQSMGGIIAQVIAHKYPTQINKLIILNSVATESLVTVMQLTSTLNLRKTNTPLENIIDVILPWVFSSDYLGIAGNIAMLKAILLNNPFPQSIADQERQMRALQAFNSHSWCHEIKTPTLVIASEQDLINFVSECQELADKIAGAKLVKIPGGHASTIEQPDKVNKAILDFLR